MKIHSTNYFNTFVEVAADCSAVRAEIPVKKGDKPTVATLQFELISKNPYKFTSDEVVFKVFAEKNELLEQEFDQARIDFFAKGQPCLRTSPLAKRYGWGLHFNAEGKIAIYGIESAAYKNFLVDDTITKYRAMRSRKS